MRKKSMMTSGILFLLIGVILLFVKQYEAAIISISFSFVMGLGILVLILMERQSNKKLDETYFVNRKEFLVRDYDKIVRTYKKDDLKSLGMVVLTLTQEHGPKVLKEFGKWLKEAFPADPKGYDDGIVILFVNIPETLMDELIKQMRKRLKELRLGVSFKANYTFYTGTEDYQTLRNQIGNTGN